MLLQNNFYAALPLKNTLYLLDTAVVFMASSLRRITFISCTNGIAWFPVQRCKRKAISTKCMCKKTSVLQNVQ